jgi:hypothetical protein
MRTPFTPAGRRLVPLVCFLLAVFAVLALAGCNLFKGDDHKSPTEPHVPKAAPVARANVSNLVGFEIVADASGSQGLDSTSTCSWSFGDGDSEGSCNPLRHVYPQSTNRTYRVTVRVCNTDAERLPSTICDDDVATVTVPQ